MNDLHIGLPNEEESLEVFKSRLEKKEMTDAIVERISLWFLDRIDFEWYLWFEEKLFINREDISDKLENSDSELNIRQLWFLRIDLNKKIPWYGLWVEYSLGIVFSESEENFQTILIDLTTWKVHVTLKKDSDLETDSLSDSVNEFISKIWINIQFIISTIKYTT